MPVNFHLWIYVPGRQQVNYNAVENDIVQGAEDQGIHEEEGGGETHSRVTSQSDSSVLSHHIDKHMVQHRPAECKGQLWLTLTLLLHVVRGLAKRFNALKTGWDWLFFSSLLPSVESHCVLSSCFRQTIVGLLFFRTFLYFLHSWEILHPCLNLWQTSCMIFVKRCFLWRQSQS